VRRLLLTQPLQTRRRFVPSSSSVFSLSHHLCLICAQTNPVFFFQLLTRLVNQGFGREGVQQGIALHGENEIKVTAYANQYDRLMRCGFDPELVARSCSIYAEDNAEAVEYINNFTKLREYGFTDVQIQDALKQHDNVLDAALNYILS